VQAFGRLKPGVTLEKAKAGLQPLMHQILEMELQDKAFATATERTKQRFLTMWMDLLPGSKGRSSLRQQFSNPLLAADGDRRWSAVDRVFQCRQPVDRARHRPAKGNRGAARARRGARAAHAPIAVRKRAAVRGRRRGWIGAGRGDEPNAP